MRGVAPIVQGVAMMLRIDAHQYFWRYTPDTHAGIDASMAAFKRDFLPRDLEPLLAAAGFDGSVAVAAQQNVTETDWLLTLADEYPFIRGVVGWVDLCAPDVAEELQRLATHPRLRGIRHVVLDGADAGALMRPDLRRGVSALAQFDLACDILVDPPQMAAATELAQTFPAQRFVLDDLGKPPIASGEIIPWARGIAAVSRNTNVYCKLSGLATAAGAHPSPDLDFTPYLDTAMQWFGPERSMIGSDWPRSTLAGSYGDAVGVVARYVERLSPRDQDAILGGTAQRVYRL